MPSSPVGATLDSKNQWGHRLSLVGYLKPTKEGIVDLWGMAFQQERARGIGGSVSFGGIPYMLCTEILGVGG